MPILLLTYKVTSPELVPSAIDAAIACLKEHPEAHVATLVTPLREKEALHDPSIVKVELTPWVGECSKQESGALNQTWRAITFSRAAIPAAREWQDSLLEKIPPLFWQHIGVYAYRRSVLKNWHHLPESPLSELESLEQLRLIEAGEPMIAVAIDQVASALIQLQITPLSSSVFLITRKKLNASQMACVVFLGHLAVCFWS